MNSIPLVSITCITFNQVNFIRDAIEGFLMQEADFQYEIIIHDDASTDGTQEIIKGYVEKYPDLIIPVFQAENQFSKNEGSILARFVWPRARGKYLALCEGDDYWTDPLKLQKQVDSLNLHPDCEICFHPSFRLNFLNSGRSYVTANYGEKSKIFAPGEVITGEGGFMPTPSLIVDRRVIENLPEWFYHAPVGDYFLQILGSLKGGALYLSDIMSVYRANVRGSWSLRTKNADNRLQFYRRQMISLDAADAFIQLYPKDFRRAKRSLLNVILRDRIVNKEERITFYTRYGSNLKLQDRLLWLAIYRNYTIRNTLSKIKKSIRKLIGREYYIHTRKRRNAFRNIK